MNRTIIRLWLLLSVFLALGLAPFLARGDEQIHQRRAANAAAIARLSTTERARLMRNLELYKKATPQQQQAAREFQQALAHDQATNHGELTAIMNQYTNWLKTITPRHRDELHHKPETTARIDLMKSIVKEEQNRVMGRFVARRGNNWGFMGGRMGDRRLTNDEFRKLFTQLETLTLPSLVPAQQAEIQGKEGIARDVQLLQALRDLDVEKRPLLVHQPAAFSELAAHIDQYTDNARIRDFIHNSGNNNDGLFGREPKLANSKEARLAIVLYLSLLAQLNEDRREVRQPSDSMLKEELLTLPPDVQEMLLQLEASDFKTDLRNTFVNRNQPVKPEVLNEVFGMGRNLRMGPGGPGGGDGPDRRGLPGGRGPGRGPRDGGPPGEGAPPPRRGSRPEEGRGTGFPGDFFFEPEGRGPPPSGERPGPPPPRNGQRPEPPDGLDN
ncbi:hypothetical protein [Planctomicrobium sp. SH664]|uniref:hypothetical protein n=1 Tax=Planctomicrobium sp. SH664 TaxID=3448125 RepID=UPI003F5B9183